jgi:predicted Zn-dependent protease
VRRRAAGGLVIGALLMAACASRGLDEPALWSAAQAEATTLLSRAAVYDDPALVAYLDGLGQRLAGVALPFHVLRDPTLNVFALPHGAVFLHTGVLAATENEAQLAVLLGHEIAHVAHRDALETGAPPRPQRALDRSAGVSRTADAIRADGLRLTAMAAIAGYGPERERAADAAGLASVLRAGWDPRQAPVIYLRLSAQSIDGGSREVFFFGNRHRLGQRIDSTRALVERLFAPTAARSTTVNGADFDRVIRPAVRENAYEEIRRGHFAAARAQLDRVLAGSPSDGLAWVYRGDLHRLESQRAASGEARAAGLRAARAAYERALEADTVPAEAHRQLGLLYYETNDVARARAEFET